MGDHGGGAGRISAGQAVSSAITLSKWGKLSMTAKVEYLDAKYKATTLAFTDQERDTLGAYTSNYDEINSRLRTAGAGFVPNRNFDGSENAIVDRDIEQMDGIFAKQGAILTDDLVVNRSFGGAKADIMKLEIGQVITDYGFVSTTINPKVNGGVKFFEIIVPAKTRAIWMRPVSSFRGENEVLFKRGTTMRVIKKNRFGEPVFQVIGQT